MGIEKWVYAWGVMGMKWIVNMLVREVGAKVGMADANGAVKENGCGGVERRAW